MQRQHYNYIGLQLYRLLVRPPGLDPLLFSKFLDIHTCTYILYVYGKLQQRIRTTKTYIKTYNEHTMFALQNVPVVRRRPVGYGEPGRAAERSGRLRGRPYGRRPQSGV